MNDLGITVKNKYGNAIQLIFNDISLWQKIKFSLYVLGINTTSPLFTGDVTLNLETSNKEIQKMIRARMKEIEKK